MPVPLPSGQTTRSRARQVVFDQIADWIEVGQLAPGETIKDAELAEYFGTSRTPVREALQMLEQLGLVETHPGRSTKVTDVDLADASRIYPLLGVLVGLAAELAAPGLRDADLEALREANDRLLAAAEAGAVADVRQADHDFHFVCVRRADNRHLEQSILNAEMHARRLETIYFGELGASRQSYDEHREIIEALRRGDGVAANALTRANFERSTRALAERADAS
jgi:DNA-binding GntR family transcriptional regulator